MGSIVPYLSVHERIEFPADTDENGIAAIGGNLSPGMLLSAYEQGIFPWYNSGEPILWWNPHSRAVLLPGALHLSNSYRRFIRREQITVTENQAFEAVIRSCCTIERPGQDGTWLGEDMVEAYLELHRLGYAHSVEVWYRSFSDDIPAGGLYGIGLGRMFCGESMFSRAANASKVALAHLHSKMVKEKWVMIDCQVMNDHLRSMGAGEIPREQYHRLLEQALSPG